MKIFCQINSNKQFTKTKIVLNAQYRRIYGEQRVKNIMFSYMTCKNIFCQINSNNCLNKFVRTLFLNKYDFPYLCGVQGNVKMTLQASTKTVGDILIK